MAKSPIRQTDDAAIAAIWKILIDSGHGALAVNGEGAPMVSRILISLSDQGHPAFLTSRLSSHFALLERDPACSVLLGAVGKGDPLAHPRLTLIGQARRVEKTPARRARFLQRHPKAALYIDFPDFDIWEIAPQRCDFNGGFGKAYRLDAEEFLPKWPEQRAEWPPNA